MLVYVRASPFVLLLKHCKTILFIHIFFFNCRHSAGHRGLPCKRDSFASFSRICKARHANSVTASFARVCLCGSTEVKTSFQNKEKTTHISEENGVVGIREQCSNETSMGHLLFDSPCPANRTLSGGFIWWGRGEGVAGDLKFSIRGVGNESLKQEVLGCGGDGFV